MLSLLLFAAAAAAQCTLPNTTLSTTITEPFGIQVQNPAFPEIHNRYLYLWESGGGDQHLYLSPAGVPATTLTLDAGILELGPLFAVIQGEYTEWDNTTKLFTTERGDPRAVFQPTHACNPDTAAPQIELTFTGRQTSPPGGNICVRLASGNRHEFRYSPPENPAHDPARPCIPVVLALTRDVPPAPSTTAGPVVPSSTAAPGLFKDVTELGWRFVGCAPEEGPAGDGLGRTLNGALYADDLLTNELCVAFCTGRGFRHASPVDVWLPYSPVATKPLERTCQNILTFLEHPFQYVKPFGRPANRLVRGALKDIIPLVGRTIFENTAGFV
ncbi:hypothetical protein ACHAQH_008623 [Verticillium albo-atrum]